MTDSEKDAEIKRLSDKCRQKDDEYEQQCQFAEKGMAELRTALVKKDAENERLKIALNKYSEDETLGRWEAEIKQLKAVNQKLWEALTPEKRHELNLAEGKK